MKAGAEFLRKKIREKGFSQREAAIELLVPATNLRQWVARGAVPAGMWESLASFLGVTAGRLREEGIKVAQSRKGQLGLVNGQDVMPLLKNIVEAGIQGMTGHELQYLFHQQDHLKQTMSPALIRELLVHRNPKAT